MCLAGFWTFLFSVISRKLTPRFCSCFFLTYYIHTALVELQGALNCVHRSVVSMIWRLIFILSQTSPQWKKSLHTSKQAGGKRAQGNNSEGEFLKRDPMH